jgi:hypothetical protein
MTYYSPARKKRRWVGPVVVLSVLVILVVAAFFVADKLARDAATGIVSAPIKSALGSTTPVSVDLGPGLFLLQAATGKLDHVLISTDGLPVGEGSAGLVLSARGLPLDPGGTVNSIHADLSLDAAAMQSVVPVAASTVTFDGEQFLVSTQADVGGTARPVVLSITPSASAGQITLTVTAVTVDGQAVSIDDARAGAYGAAAAALVSPPPLCVSSYLPASLTLATAAVQGDQLVLGFDGSKVGLSSLSTKGSCPPAA